MNKIISALIICTAITFSAVTNTNAQDSVKTALIKVANLHCNGDMPTIKKQLLNQDGVDEVSFTERDGDQSVFTVTYHSAANTQAAIEAAIEATPGCDDKSETPYRVKRERSKKNK